MLYLSKKIYLICGHLPTQVGAMTSHHNLGVAQRIILQHCYPGFGINNRYPSMNISYDLTIHYMSEISYPVKLVIVMYTSPPGLSHLWANLQVILANQSI